MAIKLLIGGSPCTHWSIAQKNNRETKPKGLGWELFKNYLIAKEKFKPDYFLYENNKSAAQPIKDQISRELGVDLMYINSALVSAQNRQRFYAFNWEVEQPEDRGILLKDILETGLYDVPVNTTDNDTKARTLMAGYYKYGTATLLTNEGFKGGTTSVAEVVDTDFPNFVEKKFDEAVKKYGELPTMYNPYNNRKITDKAKTLTTWCGSWTNSSSVTIVDRISCATTVEWDENGIPIKAVSCADGKTYTVYEVKDGQITIKGKQYPIKLTDGYYIIRKLTVAECCRLQTLPDDYCKAVSNSQAYKGLGNGWTAEVIIHILNGAMKDVPRNEEIIVLSLYDGIGTGRYCLDKMGFTNVKYYAYEIDPYPIKVSMDNYPDIIQCGDAFAVRNDDWKAPQTRSEWLDELLGDSEVS